VFTEPGYDFRKYQRILGIDKDIASSDGNIQQVLHWLLLMAFMKKRVLETVSKY
jgi:hypothetical protein